MSQTSIRLVKTPDVDRVIRFLRERFRLLSEAEIIKLALSEMYKKEQRMSSEDEQAFRTRFNRVIAEREGAGETPPSLAVLQKEAQKSGATALTPEEIAKEIYAARAAPKNRI